MYLNQRKMVAAAASAKTKMIIGIIGATFFGFGIVGGIIDYSEGLREGLAVYVVLLLPFAWLIYQSVKSRAVRDLATRVNQVFQSDADGILPMSQLVPILGAKNELEAAKKMEDLIGKGFLCNCTMDYTVGIRVVLYRQTKSGEAYTAVVCPACGASGQRRVGYAYVCPYCGTSVK